MSAEPVFVGVDGGGSHTVALVGRRAAGTSGEASGPVALGRGAAGAANPQAVGFEVAATQISRAVEAALADAGLPPPGDVTIARAVFGIAGASRPADRARLVALLAELLLVPAGAIRIVADIGLILPAAGLPFGVALVAGMGSSAFGVGRDGRTATAGGWGYLIGDDGSAFAVGREALRAVLRADGGFGPTTHLTEALSRELGVSQPRDLIRAVYQAQSPRTTVATLAPLVVATAREGDPIALQILTRAGRDLGKIARAVARRLGLGPGTVVVGTGGMFQAGGLLLEPLREELESAGLTDVRLLDDEPALGALRLAAGAAALALAL